MKPYQLRPAAEADLQGIWDYSLETWSAQRAESYVGAIFDLLHALARHPQRGQATPWLGAGYRRIRSGSHIIFYLVLADGLIDVIRILHERSDVTRHLDET